jgi:branched-chain amino acid transport system substrate-binding protein
VQLQGSGANVFFNVTTPKFAAQAIRKAYDIGWKPVQYLNNVSISVGSVLTPAGLEKSFGLITTAYHKDATDQRWADDPAMKQWHAFMKKYYPEGSLTDSFNVYGYSVAATLHQVLKQAGNELTHENIMRQAASMKDFRVDTLLPKITITTSKDDYAPIEAVQLQRFNGKQWELFGDVMTGGH